jgi:hypothetical protein
MAESGKTGWRIAKEVGSGDIDSIVSAWSIAERLGYILTNGTFPGSGRAGGGDED